MIMAGICMFGVDGGLECSAKCRTLSEVFVAKTVFRLLRTCDQRQAFRPSATESGRPYGVTSALSLSLL